MSEREVVDVVCSRPDLTTSRNSHHKNTSRNKDKHNNSGSYGRKGRVETPPTVPIRHPRQHSGSYGKQPRERGERKRMGRGRVDEYEKIASLPAQNAGSGGEGRKKLSLNHLLNFTLSPREAGGHGNTSNHGNRRRRNKTHSYNKEQFMQANCQFVVADNGDYSIHTSDPDLLVDWDSIELVRLFCHDIPSCPICLYPPTAAKITRCGHVYCWSCVLHYLSLGDKKWRKCPICYESIYKNDLKSVMALSTHQYSPGDIITMTLMVRKKDSTIVMPSQQKTKSPLILPSLTASVGRFVKLLTCSPTQSLEVIIRQERDALTTQLKEMTDDEATEQCFVELALEELKCRERRLLQSQCIESEVVEDTSPSRTNTLPLPQQQWMALADSYIQADTMPAISDSEEGEDGSGGTSSNVSDISIHNNDTSMDQPISIPPTTTPPDNSLVYFYQSDDGQHIYLHTVNARCLVKEYGGLEFAPNTIKARIVEMEQLSMTEDARGKYKYLGHLPVTCEFSLCELDLRPPLVSSDTLAYYHDDLERRRRKRMKKRRDEKRREKTASATQRPPPTRDSFPLPTSLYHQPLSPEKIHDILPQLTSSPPLNNTTSPHLNPVAQEFIPDQSTHVQGNSIRDDLNESSMSHPSFAQALRGKPPPVWPIKTSPRQQAASTRAHIQQTVRDEGDEEGEESVPSFQEAFTQALYTAQVSTQQGQCSKKTAKKGRKKLVLFSTGGARGSQN